MKRPLGTRRWSFWKPGRKRNRRLLFEPLDIRNLLAADWQNPFNPRDVDGNQVVTPRDALLQIDELNQRTLINESGRLPDRALHPTAPWYDFSGDGFLGHEAKIRSTT